MRLWNASTGDILKVLTGHDTKIINSVAFASDGRIVSGSWDKSVRVWNAATGETLAVLESRLALATTRYGCDLGYCKLEGRFVVRSHRLILLSHSVSSHLNANLNYCAVCIYVRLKIIGDVVKLPGQCREIANPKPGWSWQVARVEYEATLITPIFYLA